MLGSNVAKSEYKSNLNPINPVSIILPKATAMLIPFRCFNDVRLSLWHFRQHGIFITIRSIVFRSLTSVNSDLISLNIPCNKLKSEPAALPQNAHTFTLSVFSTEAATLPIVVSALSNCFSDLLITTDSKSFKIQTIIPMTISVAKIAIIAFIDRDS